MTVQVRELLIVTSNVLVDSAQVCFMSTERRAVPLHMRVCVCVCGGENPINLTVNCKGILLSPYPLVYE